MVKAEEAICAFVGTVKDPEKEPAKNAVRGRGHGGAMAKGPRLGADLLKPKPGPGAWGNTKRLRGKVDRVARRTTGQKPATVYLNSGKEKKGWVGEEKKEAKEERS